MWMAGHWLVPAAQDDVKLSINLVVHVLYLPTGTFIIRIQRTLL